MPFITKHDMNLPNITPFTGEVSDKTFKKIIDILCESVDIKKNNVTKINIHNIRKKMEHQKKAPIKSISTGITYVDKNKRNSNRKTFRKDIMKKIAILLINEITNNERWKNNYKIDFEVSHGDILYYQSGDFFGQHRDEELKSNRGKKWNMYTLVMGISNNIDRLLDVSDGHTIVYTPPYQLRGKYKRHYSKHKLQEHSFIESCLSKKYLVFPSRALHESSIITQKNGYKMCLKVDLWIKSDNIWRNTNCQCNICYPMKIQKNYINHLNNIFSLDLSKIIMMYVYKNKKQICTHINNDFYTHCQCSCYPCVSSCFNNQYDMDDCITQDYYDDDYCNGYDD